MLAFKLAFLAAVGWTAGWYLVTTIRMIVLDTLAKRGQKKRNAAHLARVAEIEAQWRKMPNRDDRGRFAKKSD